jgi:hypothetical protein
MRHIRTLRDMASALFNAVARGPLLASAHRELSVILLLSQGYVHHASALVLARDAGRQVLPGAHTPFLAGVSCRGCCACLLVVPFFCVCVFGAAFASLTLVPFFVNSCVCFLAPMSAVTAHSKF